MNLETSKSMKETSNWPKKPVPLTSEQEIARDKFMMEWHEMLPTKYSMLEKFNHGYIAKLPRKKGVRTLDIGAGLGEHARYEDLRDQEYHFMEYREEFCERIRRDFPQSAVLSGDIEKGLPYPDGHFDRIIAVHVLEHLRNLPPALKEISRLMKPDGYFDVVLPAEGGLAYEFARMISSQRYFEKRFGMSYRPIIQNEHVNTYREVAQELNKHFYTPKKRFFPLVLPVTEINLVIAARYYKRAN